MKEIKIDEAVWREMARKSLDTMDSINAKWCQEELERIKAGTYPDTNFDCSNCPHPCCDPKTAFLSELQSLLRNYSAKINFGFNVYEKTCGVIFDIGDERIFYPFKIDEMDDDPAIIWQIPSSNYPITPDNIFNYDKE